MRNILLVNDLAAWNSVIGDSNLRKKGKKSNRTVLLICLLFLKFKGYESIYIKEGINGKTLYHFLRKAGMTKHYAKRVVMAYTEDSETFGRYFKPSKFGEKFLCFAANKGSGTNTYFYTGDVKQEDAALKLNGNKEHHGIWIKDITEKNIKIAINTVVFRDPQTMTEIALKDGNGVEILQGDQNDITGKDGCVKKVVHKSYRTIRHKTGFSFKKIASYKKHCAERCDVEVKCRTENYFGIKSEKVGELEKKCAEDNTAFLCKRKNDLTGLYDVLIRYSTEYYYKPEILPKKTVSAKPSAKKKINELGSAAEKRDFTRKRIRRKNHWMTFDKLIDPISKERKVIVEGGHSFETELVQSFSGSKEERVILAIENALNGEPAYSFKIWMNTEGKISDFWVEETDEVENPEGHLVLSYDRESKTWERGMLKRIYNNGVITYSLKGKEYSGESEGDKITRKDKSIMEMNTANLSGAETFRVIDLSFLSSVTSILSAMKTKLKNERYKPEKKRREAATWRFLPTEGTSSTHEASFPERENKFTKSLEKKVRRYLENSGKEIEYFTELRNALLSSGKKAERSVTEQFFYIKDRINNIISESYCNILKDETNPETTEKVKGLFKEQLGYAPDMDDREADAFLSYMKAAVGVAKYPIYLPKLQMKIQYDQEHKKLKEVYDKEDINKKARAKGNHQTEAKRILRSITRRIGKLPEATQGQYAETLRTAETLVSGVLSTYSYEHSLNSMRVLRRMKESIDGLIADMKDREN